MSMKKTQKHSRNNIIHHTFTKTHPKYTDHNVDPPNHTIVVEFVLKSEKGQYYNKPFHNYLCNTVGDADVSNARNTHYAPALQLSTGCPLMVNSNVDLKEKSWKQIIVQIFWNCIQTWKNNSCKKTQ